MTRYIDFLTPDELRAMGIDPHADEYLVPDALPLELQDLPGLDVEALRELQ